MRTTPPAKMHTTSVVTVLRSSSSSDDGDGPYFDLEFTIPDKSEFTSESVLSISEFDTNNQAKSSPKSESTSKTQFSSKVQIFLLKFKSKPKPVEEVRIISLLKKQDAMEERKGVINKYLNKIKPFRKKTNSSEKTVRFGGEVTATENEQKGKKGSITSSVGLRKSRSASAAVVSVRSPPGKGCDDSLAVMEDGIRSAIAHCKRSLISGTELGLARCRSDPGEDRST